MSDNIRKVTATHLTIEELAKLLVDLILDEQHLNKQVLIPKTEALIKTMVGLKHTPKDYNTYVNPNKDANRLRTIEERNAELEYWVTLVKKLDGGNIKKYFNEKNETLKKLGFRHE